MRGVVVAKFGGSVLSSGQDYLRAAREVARLREERDVVVVVSAMKGVTDQLIEAAARGNGIDSVFEKYSRALEEALGRGAGEWLETLYNEFNKLNMLLWAVRVLGEANPRAQAYITSFGERLSTLLMAAALESQGVPARRLMGGDAGIITDSNWLEAEPLDEESRPLARLRLGSLLESGIVPVVAGFTGATRDGAVTLLGRGGSDLSATLLARYLDAEEARLYTVAGAVMSGDPRRIPYARLVERMSFSEASEIARLGTRKFHPRTFEPLEGSNVRVTVTGIGSSEGTVIDARGGGPPVKAVSVLEDLSLIIVEGKRLPGRIGALARAARLLAEAGVNIVSVAQPPSETSMAFIVAARDAQRAQEVLEQGVNGGRYRVYSHEGVSAVGVVGHGVHSSRILGRIHELSMERGTLLISWSPASPSVSSLVDSRLAWELAATLHEEVVLGAG